MVGGILLTVFTVVYVYMECLYNHTLHYVVTQVPGSYTRSRLQSQTGEHHSQHPSSQPAPPQAMGHVQHIYPRPGSPEVGHKASSGIGGDLAAIIAAKAASRKPMVTSPTRKEHFAEDLLSRSMTVSVESTVMDAR